jgi:hypothetical protein
MSKKVSINWDTANDYIKGVCKEAGVWWNAKSQKARENFDSDNRPSKTNSNAFVVKELIADGHIGWAVFFVGEALTENDLKSQVEFVIAQIPKNITEDDYVRGVMAEINACKQTFDVNPEPSLLSKMISCVKRLDNYQGKKKSDEVVLKILDNSIKLLEKEI